MFSKTIEREDAIAFGTPKARGLSSLLPSDVGAMLQPQVSNRLFGVGALSRSSSNHQIRSVESMDRSD